VEKNHCRSGISGRDVVSLSAVGKPYPTACQPGDVDNALLGEATAFLRFGEFHAHGFDLFLGGVAHACWSHNPGW